jgi:adenylate cyclase
MGDGVLAEFGSAVNAVQCAVDLQRRMEEANADLTEDRRILLRIGIKWLRRRLVIVSALKPR